MPANLSSPEKSWATFTSAAVWTSRRKAPSSAISSLPASALRTAPTSRAASKSTQPNPKPPPTKPVTKSGVFAQLTEPRRASKAEKPPDCCNHVAQGHLAREHFEISLPNLAPTEKRTFTDSRPDIRGAYRLSMEIAE